MRDILSPGYRNSEDFISSSRPNSEQVLH